MKLYKSLATAAVVTLGLSVAGCSDWLDYTPKDKQLYEQQFATADGFHTTVNGVYSLLTSSSLYGYNLSYGAIDAMGLSYNVSQTNSTLYQLKTASYSSTNAASTLSNIWSTAYNTILNANLVLQALDEYPGVLSENDSQLIRAEMLAVRAYLHLDLTRIFGPIPTSQSALSGEAVPFADTPEALKRERLAADVILTEHIIPDLTEAQNILEKIDPIMTEGVLNSDGGSTNRNWERYRQLRMNYFAVTLLKARAYMWMLDYTNALAEARKITDSPVAKNAFPWVVGNRLLANSINPDRGFSTECLFGYYNNEISNIYKNYFAGSLDASKLLQVASGYVSTIFPISSDYRFQAQWRANGGMNAGYEFVKYESFEPSSTNPDFWATFYGLLRVPEAYYIAAEAALKLNNDTETARNYLNTIRTARGVMVELEENISVADLQKEIELEYVRELRGEGQNFFLLKRLNASVGSFMSGAKTHLNGSDDPGMDSPSKTVRYRVPIPSSETF